MKNELLKLCSAMLVLGAIGCGGNAAEGESEDELSATKLTHVSLRRDERRCAAPTCGGFYVRDANKGTAEQYVETLDFSASKLDEATIAGINAAPASELVLQGRLTAVSSKSKQRSFRVTSAFRGMPGLAVPSGDAVYATATTRIQCVAAPCLDKTATKINDGSVTYFSTLDLGAASAGFVDQAWLASRVRDHGALVAAQVVDGAKLQTGADKVLAAAQVFVKLPEAVACPPNRAMPIQCAAGQVATFARDENRCLTQVACVKPGVCSQLVPSCGAGYSLVQWRSGASGCQTSVCEPTFSL